MTFNTFIFHPLTALFVTMGSFLLAQWIQKRMNGHSLLNPVVLSIIIVVSFLIMFDIPYKQYLQNVHLINGLLGPATVALAIPLYHQLARIKKSLLPIGLSISVASLVAAGTGYFLAHKMGAATDIQLALIPKSATTPIAIEIAEKIGTDPSLAVFFVFTTGIIGSVIAGFIFKLVRITDEKAIGLALGVTCHGLGVARALQISEKAGAFAALGMSLMGIISGIVLPILVLWLLV